MLTLFLALLILKVLTGLVLDLLNLQHVSKHRSERPDALKDVVDAETYEKSVDYTVEKARFGILSSIFDAIVLAVVVASGLLGGAFGALTEMWGDGIWAQAAILFAIPTILGLIDLPFDFYQQFKIEEKFGFNKSSVGLWIADQFKNFWSEPS